MIHVINELKAAIKTFEEKSDKYGNMYKVKGEVMSIIFPDGVKLKTPEDFNRYTYLSAVIAKMMRYAAQFENGGHYDSAHDAIVFAAMLNGIDSDASDRKKKETMGEDKEGHV